MPTIQAAMKMRKESGGWVALDSINTFDFCILKPIVMKRWRWRIFSTSFLSSVERSDDSFCNWIKKCATANRYTSLPKRACHNGLLMAQDNSISLKQPSQRCRQKISLKYRTYISEPSELDGASWRFCMLRTWCCSDPLMEGERERDRKRLE